LSSPKTILSIQSEVVTGHVGNAAARFALQRLGHEAWGVPTIILSSHAGHQGFAGEATTPALLTKLLEALSAQGRLALADGVLSGYLGSAEQAAIVADAVRRTKAAHKTALYCMDPVFGDDGRIYARPGVAEAMASTLLPLADIVTPNAFELATLSGLPVTTAVEAVAAAEALGRPIVVATSVPAGPERIGTLLLAGGEALLASTPRLVDPPRGAGDLFASLLFGQMIGGAAAGDALELAVRATYHILSVSAGQPEMALIAEQEALASPPVLESFKLERLPTRSDANG
jgi:pyridoxine kinase